MSTTLNQRTLTAGGIIMRFVMEPKELRSAKSALAKLLDLDDAQVKLFVSGSVDLGEELGVVELDSYVKPQVIEVQEVDDDGNPVFELDKKGNPTDKPKMKVVEAEGPLPRACVEVMTIGKTLALKAQPPVWDGDEDIDILADYLPVDTIFELVIDGCEPTIGIPIPMPASVWGEAPAGTAKKESKPKTEPEVAKLQAQIKAIMEQHKAASDAKDQKEVNRLMDELRQSMALLKKLNNPVATKK